MGTQRGPWGQQEHGVNEDMGTMRTRGGHQGQRDVGGHGVSMEKVRT